ncbi:MAG: SET domain-containing protein, partial [Patescibacteria group bacterium]
MNTLFLGKSKLGKAVFANKNFKRGEGIIEFKGPLIKRNELPEITTQEDDRYIQIGKDEYLGPSGDFDDFVNHSCDPNSGIKFVG